MARGSEKFDVILLAAERAGRQNPLAKAHAVSHKCIVPIAGEPLIQRTLSSLLSHPGCRAVHVVIEADGEAEVRSLFDGLVCSQAVHYVRSSDNIAESIFAGCQQAVAPYVVTTADNVLITHNSIDQILTKLASGADAAAALAKKEDILLVHPAAQRHFYEFRDGGWANCNLYAIAGEKGLGAIEVFREGGQFMSSRSRLIKTFGLFNIAIMLLRLATMAQACVRISKRFGVTIDYVRIADGTQAVDVDNDRTYQIVEAILKGRVTELEPALI